MGRVTLRFGGREEAFDLHTPMSLQASPASWIKVVTKEEKGKKKQKKKERRLKLLRIYDKGVG